MWEKSVPVLEPNSFHFHKYNKNGTNHRLQSKTGGLLFLSLHLPYLFLASYPIK